MIRRVLITVIALLALAPAAQAAASWSAGDPASTVIFRGWSARGTEQLRVGPGRLVLSCRGLFTFTVRTASGMRALDCRGGAVGSMAFSGGRVFVLVKLRNMEPTPDIDATRRLVTGNVRPPRETRTRRHG